MTENQQEVVVAQTLSAFSERFNAQMDVFGKSDLKIKSECENVCKITQDFSVVLGRTKESCNVFCGDGGVKALYVISTAIDVLTGVSEKERNKMLQSIGLFDGKLRKASVNGWFCKASKNSLLMVQISKED